MRRLSTFLFCAVIASCAAGCGSDIVTEPTSTTTTTVTGNTYTLTGTLKAPVSGVLQSMTHQFLLPASASVAMTLVSGNETLLDGTSTSAVPINIGLGSIVGGACVVPAGTAVNATFSADVQLTRTLPAGTNCLLVRDVTALEGPLTYKITLKY